jgi:hyperpolarization activated cyclic nucleotide-gated potassium channel 2
MMLEEEDARQPHGLERFLIIRVDAGWKLCWDFCVAVAFAYSSFQVPYALAFDENNNQHQSFWQAFNMSIDCTYMLDIVLSFLTERYCHGLLVSRLRHIAGIYLREEFVLDLLGSFPFDSVASAIAQSSGSAHVDLTALRAFKLARLLRLLRGARVVKTLQALEERSRGRFSRALHLARSTGALIFTAHTLGCLFVLLAAAEPADDNWLAAYAPELAPGADGGGGRDLERYVVCLYWAIISISTMGYGDIVPKTTAERCYAVMVAIVGSVAFAFCVNGIGRMLAASSGFDDALRAAERRLREVMEFRGLPLPLQQRCLHHLRGPWARSGEPYGERAALALLPPALRREALAETARAAAQAGRIPRSLLAPAGGLGAEAVGALLAHAGPPAHFAPGEVIYRRGDAPDGMYVILAGEVALLAPRPPTPPEPFLAGGGCRATGGRLTGEKGPSALSSPARPMSPATRRRLFLRRDGGSSPPPCAAHCDPSREGGGGSGDEALAAGARAWGGASSSTARLVGPGGVFGLAGVFPDLAGPGEGRAEQAVARAAGGGAGVEALFVARERWEGLAGDCPALCRRLRRLCELQVGSAPAFIAGSAAALIAR